ncbi:type IX secretion system outer membrane channel protein PorV [Chryseobacterium salipaludis]|uniref:type IX secretion system outer membrane channel protein PorV n=1 Tax=Chryseobacterium TaxID=59732 RepID=UPI001FF6A465|nr:MULTISPECIES: type IX secretion system outer membrane channel protein PorV [Chryseobacterium]MCJ8496979.1 type IX secretion system outer membrane channel protein PorV [Chryseobacterium salipaludis]MCX3296460.1 type IX secretion system outer membrane channel protein PorV [Planobacterium sp. JC490]
MAITKKLLLGLGIGMGVAAQAQVGDIQPVLTGAPFLRISPDARAGGMGDQGVATTSDAFSQFWNAAKYPFSKTTSAIGLNYTPYMGKVTNDVFLLYGAYHQFLGDEERSTISASIYYFNMGSVDLTKLVGSEVVTEGTAKPNEFSIDVAYGLKLSDYYSMAVTGRFIRSDLSGGFNSDNTLKAANSFAVDVSGYFQSEKHTSFGDYEGRARGGFAVQNLGPRLDYTGDDESRSYLPTMARIGAGYDLFIDDLNRVGVNLEASKLLVAGPDASGDVPNVGVIEGIGKSFSNKKSLMFSGALEYEYDNAFAVRGGYFYESPEQGARQYATLGVGLKYQSFGLDMSYLINTSKLNSALDNTLRFGLTWNIGEESSNADY